MANIHPDISKVIISEEELAARTRAMGAEISKDYQDKDVVLVAVLKGAVYFMADLSRQLDCQFEMDFMAVSSYGNQRDSSGVVRILKDLDVEIDGRHILIVEDILDTGLTLKYLIRKFEAAGAASVEVAACLLKDRERTGENAIDVKYVGFDIPNEFVVGYGLDYAEHYRGLPYIGVLKPEVYTD